ncbi:hypothetical protein [Anaerostipes sp.]|uniref:hypothetical protein n=1 Tax=Anaerostipes sp. TaxID=1872530 RepID=UPI0025BCB34F|nr:hypothetical protein [Anaerostipes sp.]MBS7007565.1 hypothetical protein [Anaerostipes sp.]
MANTNKKVQTSEQKKMTTTVAKQMQEVAKTNQTKIKAEDKRLYNSCITAIQKEYKKVELSSLKIAFLLHKVYKKKLYKIDSYKNIYDFAKDKFEIARGTTSNFINICEKFGVFDEGNLLDIRDDMKNYGFSKLTLLLNCPESFIEQCDPSMSVREIKEMKREYTDLLETAVDEMKGVDTNTSDTDESDFMSEPACDEDGVILDVPKNAKDMFVCSVSNYDELLKLKEVIEDALKDAKKTKKSNPHLEIKVVF